MSIKQSFAALSCVAACAVLAQATPGVAPVPPSNELEWKVEYDEKCLAAEVKKCVAPTNPPYPNLIVTSITVRNHGGCPASYTASSSAGNNVGCTPDGHRKTEICALLVKTNPPEACERHILTKAGWSRVMHESTSSVIKAIEAQTVKICEDAGGTRCDAPTKVNDVIPQAPTQQ